MNEKLPRQIDENTILERVNFSEDGIIYYARLINLPPMDEDDTKNKGKYIL